jgi:hypothetical protein
MIACIGGNKGKGVGGTGNEGGRKWGTLEKRNT